MKAGHSCFEIEGGIGVVGRGPDAAAALVQTALGVFALLADPSGLAASDRREVRAHGADIGELAASWIAECLYVHDLEGFAARAIELAAFEATPRAGGEPLRLHAFLDGEEVDAARHHVRAAIKGVRRPALAAGPVEGGWEIRIVVAV